MSQVNRKGLETAFGLATSNLDVGAPVLVNHLTG
jgi:hypothetical protein